MDTHKYTCKYCHVQYIPKRRHAQKYCSNSCRSKAYHRRQVENNMANNKTTFTIKDALTPTQSTQVSEKATPQKQTVEQMSFAGVGNAVVGTLVADLLKYILQGNGNQPATKNDILTLVNKLGRYHLITNMASRPFGQRPYFDLHTNQVVYL